MRRAAALLLAFAAPLAEGQTLLPGPPELAAHQPVYTELVPGGQVTPASHYACPTEGYCQSACSDCYQQRFTGWSFDAGVLLLRARHSNSTFTFDQEDPMVGGRLQLGYEGEGGMGVSFRFSAVGDDELSTVGLDPPNPTIPADFSLGQFDIDFYQRFWWNDTSLVVGVGPRVGGYDLSFPGGAFYDLSTGGLGALIELRKPIYRGELTEVACIGSGRLSYLTGEVELLDTNIVADSTMTIGEIALGVEARRRMGRGDLVASYQVEAQNWESSVIPQFGLIGSSFNVGYHW